MGLARAGLPEEALAELRLLLAAPGGARRIQAGARGLQPKVVESISQNFCNSFSTEFLIIVHHTLIFGNNLELLAILARGFRENLIEKN